MLYTSKALSIFNLQSETYKPDGQYLQGVNDEHCKVIANAIGCQAHEFQSQLEDMRPRALHEAKILLKAKDNNKSAWAECIRKVNAHKSVAENHPTSPPNPPTHQPTNQPTYQPT